MSDTEERIQAGIREDRKKDHPTISAMKHEVAIREWNLCVGVDGNIGPLHYAAAFEGLPMRLPYGGDASATKKRALVVAYLRKWADALERKPDTP